MPEKIKEINVVQAYKEDMTRYAIADNRRRAVPDRKDGLKIVHRRIIDYMYYNEPCEKIYVKSSAVAGGVSKKSHPHGDSAIYDAMKPMANWFEINMPLIDPHGNFGSFQGDGAAASRYTEVKLSKFALDCVISELQETQEVVDWVETYDGRAKEPEYFPVNVPLLLINGSFGIGVGLMTSIPRHNLNDVINATLKLMDNPNASITLIPDHCMPCNIINTNFKAIGNKGEGNYRVRGIIDIEEYKGKPALVIKSVPDLTFLDSVTDTIDKMVKENKLVQVVKLIEDSNKKQMRFIILLKKGSDPNFVRETIYKTTLMEKSCKVNFEVMDGIEPMRMSYKSYLLGFIEFRKITKFRLYCNKLQDVETKIHEKEAYIKIIESGEIDYIIDRIKKQSSIDDNSLMEYLITKYNITDLQAQYIMNKPAKTLSMAYLNKYKQEVTKWTEEAQDYLNKITHDEVIVQEIRDELILYKNKYGRPRNCKLVDEQEDNGIPKGEFKVVITENNFVKKVPLNDNIGSFRGDTPKHIIKVDNTQCILLLDNKGKVFKLPIHKIPFTDRNSNGTDIRLLCKNLTANIVSVIYEPTLTELTNKTTKYFITIVTAKNSIKKLDLEDLLNVPPSGIIYIKLSQNDYVVDVNIIPTDEDIIVYTNDKALRFNLSEVQHLKRSCQGSSAMKTDEDIKGLSVIYHNVTDIVVVTKNGYVNRFSALALPRSTRYKAGTNMIKLSKTDCIYNIFGVNENSILSITTRNNRIEIPISDIPSGSSISSGTKMVSLNNDNILKCGIIRNHK